MNLLEAIEKYNPCNEQERKDKEVILDFLHTAETPFLRTNRTAHMTASAWIVNRERTKVLFCYHTIYDSWAWTGGHADGNEDLLAVAVKEAMEETGIRIVKPVSENIFSLEVLPVNGHEKAGEYVSSHLHMNVTYLLEADDREELRACSGENSAVAWFSPNEVLQVSSEPWFVQRIYGKLIDKMKTEV